MSFALPSAGPVHVFGQDYDSKSHKCATPSEIADEDVDLEDDSKRRSMYVELLDDA
jgi:hypothetical protein